MLMDLALKDIVREVAEQLCSLAQRCRVRLRKTRQA